MRTPVVSAIGHEPDNPVLDHVADLRAATPTDAAKRVVPDVAAELQYVAELRSRASSALRSWVSQERRHLSDIRTRPVMANPLLPVTTQRDLIDEAVHRKDRALHNVIRHLRSEIHSYKAQVNALGLPRHSRVVTPSCRLFPGRFRCTSRDECGGCRTRLAVASTCARWAYCCCHHGRQSCPRKRSYPQQRQAYHPTTKVETCELPNHRLSNHLR